MIFHCTKKLMAKLPDSLPKDVENTASIGLLERWQHWHANVITIQRKQCVILVHDSTRYALFIPGMNKKQLADFDLHFQDVFINSLMKAGVALNLIDKATRYLMTDNLQLDTICNRSVQGTMRLMADEVDWHLKYNSIKIDNLAIYSTSAWLSDRPCNIKGQKDCMWPIKAMTELLTQLPDIQISEGINNPSGSSIH